MQRLEFLISDGPRRGEAVPLPGTRFVIGSDSTCEVHIEGDAVAPRHAEVTFDGQGQPTIRDLSGRNTVVINGIATSGAELPVGAFVRIGAVDLVLRETGPSGPHGTLASVAVVDVEPTQKHATPALSQGSSGNSALESIRTDGIDLDAALAVTGEQKVGAPLKPGEVIGQRYRIVGPLASGGMGEVYKAEHTELGRPFAVKVMRPHLSHDKDFVTRFKREAVAASAIGNLHIIDVSDFGQTADGRFYFAMEYLAGETLTDIIQRQGAQSVERAARLGVQIARALSAAHAKGIVHRDLKPDNVMVLQDRGQPDLVKVLDFGVAKVTRASESSGQTTMGVVVGTPQYMSPEQASGLNVDPRSDVYALGLILYELVCGRPVFNAPTGQMVMAKQIHEQPAPMEPPGAPLPRGFEGLVMDMLAKAPAARPQSMNEVVKRLVDVEHAARVTHPPTGVVARPPSQPSKAAVPAPAPEPPSAAPSNTTRWVLLGAFVAAVGLGAFGVFATSAKTEVPRPSVAEVAPPRPVVVAPPTPPPVPAAPVTPVAVPVGPEAGPVAVTVTLITEPAGAQVRVGEVLKGTTPWPMTAPTGTEQRVTFSLPGYLPKLQVVRFVEAGVLTVALQRVVQVKPPPPTPSRPLTHPLPAEQVPLPPRKATKSLDDQ